MTPIIQLTDVHKSFGDRTILDGITLPIYPGKTTAIIGPSGAGKSVLLKHIIGLIQPDSGEVMVHGVDMARAKEREKLKLRKKFGMLFQNGALFDDLSAGENVEFPLRYHSNLSEEQRRELAETKLKLVELDGFYDHPTPALSGGQRKRVGLARAIVMDPDVVLFDEPNSGLDPLTSDTIDNLIGRMKITLGITFIVITHDIISCVNIADYIGMIYEGKLIEFATMERFIRSTNPVVRAFLKRNIPNIEA
jgi:phospholipid/cholesterol/gamma-HCH transport system ATP-binding protein